jgi:UDP-N-acetylglucosamine:LPS N-acetylglucosamine transferase
VNCGSFGDVSYVKVIKDLLEHVNGDYHFIIVCGNNKTLYAILKNYTKGRNSGNFTLLGFTEHIDELLSISNICITKGGANTIYECLVSQTIPLVISFHGLHYQERGVYSFLKECFNLDFKFESMESLIRYLNDPSSKTDIENNMIKIQKVFQNGAEEIVNRILSDIQK